MVKKQNGKGGQRKKGRTQRKALRRGSPESLFAQGKISGEKYFQLTKKRSK